MGHSLYLRQKIARSPKLLRALPLVVTFMLLWAVYRPYWPNVHTVFMIKAQPPSLRTRFNVSHTGVS